ncbi:MAG: formylmethanofuran dehydrogenase subunit C [Planctomycetales bacterium]|nr:formylmethanofuran dehydrogenase subunit C [Planctomycetales bacterium]
MLTLRLTCAIDLPIDARSLLPGASATLAEVQQLPVGIGSERFRAADLFDISGDPADRCWRFAGDLSRVNHLGALLSGGRITVEGSVGRHCGARMTSGSIAVEGAAGDLLGAEMRGGSITVKRHAGSLVGGAYRGSKLGMRGGQIVVHGSAGNEVGHAMRRGVIVVAGDCGELAGYRMRAGTLLVYGDCGSNPGLDMLRGTIGLFGESRPALPASFRESCRLDSPVLRLLKDHVRGAGAESLAARTPLEVSLHSGDMLRGGRGEVFTR